MNRSAFPAEIVSTILGFRVHTAQTTLCSQNFWSVSIAANTEVALSETELHHLIAGRLEGVYHSDACRLAFGDREHFGDGLSQPSRERRRCSHELQG